MRQSNETSISENTDNVKHSSEPPAAAALQCAARGLPVFPLLLLVKRADTLVCSCTRGQDCPAAGKHPAVKNWAKSATCDPDAIKKWARRWPGCGWGMPTGSRSGVDVIDADGSLGRDSLLSLELDNAALPDSWRVTTPRGTHYYFKHCGRLRTGAGMLPGIDVRADGGFVVLPGSRHRSGHLYDWEQDYSPDDCELVDPPDWLVDALTDGQEENGYKRAEPLPDMIPEGMRNKMLMSLAGSMRQRGASESAILAAIAAENQLRCNPPLPTEELHKIAASAASYPPGAALLIAHPAAERVGDVSDNGDLASPDGEPLNDVGNARRLIKAHGDDIRFCHDAGRWYCWDGRRWARDETGEVVRKGKDVIDTMLRQADELCAAMEANGDKAALQAAKNFRRHALSSGNHQRVLSMLAQAESEPSTAVLAAQMDADPWAFNCLNGTIDLRTGELRPHNRVDMISKLSPVVYDPDAKAPVWEQFLQDIFQRDQELIQFVQAAAGYTMTGDTREQVFFILHGRGSNGKTTFITVMREILGDYQVKTNTETLVEKNNPGMSNDVAALRGARLVSAIETSAGKRLAEALIKELTGQDAITARFLYKEFFTFVPLLKLWLVCNHAPVIQGQDHAIWRRVRLVPFTTQFQEPDHPTGPYMDKTLPDRLKSEYSGILTWLVHGCLGWQTAGLPTAETVKAATGSLRKDMDVLAGFIDECCVIEQGAEASAKLLYSAYCRWSEANREKPLSQRWFGLRLSERGIFERIHRKTGWAWIGIRLRSEIDGDPGTLDPDDPW